MAQDSDAGVRRTSDRSTRSTPRLGTRILVTWLELTLTGLVGAFVGTSVGGVPAFVVYLATTLLSVGILFHNVNELVKAWVIAPTVDS